MSDYTNDYKLLYLYHLADNDGELKNEYRSEYERLKLLYSIDRAKNESKDYLKELGYIEYTGEGKLEHGEWIVTKEADKETPYVITQKGLDVLDEKVFESETAFKNLQQKVLEYQKRELEYKEEIQAQEAVIRWWKLITAIVGILGVAACIIISVLARFGYHF